MRYGRASALFAASVVVVATASWLAPTAGAQVYEGDVTIIGDCTGVRLLGSGVHILDRDNTGVGEETWSVVIRDGLGTEIANQVDTNGLGTYSGGMGNVSFDLAPSSNPISVVITSLAGNGLPAVADAPRVVRCESLPEHQQTPSTRPEIVTTTSTPPTTTTSRPAATTTTTTSVTTTMGSVTPTTVTIPPTIPLPVDTVPGGPGAAGDNRNCTEIGQVNIPQGSPLYRPDLDSDRDGIACESGSAPAARPIAANASYTG